MQLAGVDIATEKRALRQRLRSARAALPRAAVRAASAEACERLNALPISGARTIALYAPLHGELDPTALAAGGAVLLFPRVVAATWPRLTFHVSRPSALIRGDFGLAVPPPEAPEVALDEADLVVVPGVAFARDGHRLGLGGGYYDVALRKAPRPLRVGLCHTFQLFNTIPHGATDEAVDWVVTPDGVLSTLARRSTKEALS